MFNLKLSGIVAGSAFILSLLIGLLSRTLLPALIIRPLIFAAIFFIITNLITLLVNRFLPELLEDTDKKEPEIMMPGSNFDIMEDNPMAQGGIYARPDDSEETMGDISFLGNSPSSSAIRADALSTEPAVLSMEGMDQSKENGYTEEGQLSAASGNGMSFDTLPDLESLAGAFAKSSGEEEPEEYEGYLEGSASSGRAAGGKTPPKMEGDFKPQELAQGIRTILKKEEG